MANHKPATSVIRELVSGVLRMASPHNTARLLGWRPLALGVLLVFCWLLATTTFSADDFYRAVSAPVHHPASRPPHRRPPAGGGGGGTGTETPVVQDGWSLANGGKNKGGGDNHHTSSKHVPPPPTDSSSFEYSIKPMAYIFPQFHAFKENDEFWGENFTEWTFVKKVEKNGWGVEVLKPAPEVGYYNLLDFDVRARQGRWLKEIGVYGVCYHHYWFGRPVMDKVLAAQLEDNEPNVPFMLSWANEPWTRRWDGQAGDPGQMLLAQDYGGIKAWREHFDWLLPYFKHPRHVRSADGRRVQFAIYNLPNVGDVLPRMFAAWRTWAVEEGLGGLDVIETRINGDPWDRGDKPDAIAEFAPRAEGSIDGTLWSRLDRYSEVYHRGMHVGWDNTPRHPDGGASGVPFNHPDLWKNMALRLFERVKSDPNPHGEDNYVFINALNEWGEGNVLEQSVQWGDRFGRALKAALDESEEIPWAHELVDAGLRLSRELEGQEGQDVDVCVLIPVGKLKPAWAEYQHLPQMLRSLQLQHNGRWRAMVFRAFEDSDPRNIERQVLDTHDPRIQIVSKEVPPEALKNDKGRPNPGAPWVATDWVLKNLGPIKDKCGHAAYFVVANPTSIFSPTVFDAARGSSNGGSRNRADIIGLSFVSKETIQAAEYLMPWDERCTRIAEGNADFCVPSTPDSAILDIGALLISLPKFLEGDHDLYNSTNRMLDVPDLVFRHGWTWASAPMDAGNNASPDYCDVVHAETYHACRRNGRFWLDSPRGAEKFRRGCYSHGSMQGEFKLDTSLFDMESFLKGDARCIRVNEETYDTIL